MKTIVSQPNNTTLGADDLPAGPDDLPAGPDDLPPSIMKQLSNKYCIPLTYLINLSVLQGDFPSEMKLAKVLPIYKVDNYQLIQNYRLISVLKFSQNLRESNL